MAQSFKDLIQKGDKILLHGGFGVRNLGDNAIQSGMLKILEDMTDNRIYALSLDKEYDKGLYNNINNFTLLNIKNPIDVLKGILKCNIIIFGGGGRFGPETGANKGKLPLEGFFPFILTMLCKISGKRVIFYAIGCTRINHKFLTFLTLKLANYVSVRDEISRETLKTLRIDATMDTDPAFTLKPLPKNIGKRILEEEGIPINDKTICLNFRFVDDWHLTEYKAKEFNKILVEKIAEMTMWLINEGYTVIFIPFNKHKYKILENDLRIAQSLTERLNSERFKILKGDYKPKEIMSVMINLDMCIGMRLHSLIFAYISKIPFRAIIYDRKVEAFLKQINQIDNNIYVEDLLKINLKWFITAEK